MITIAIAVAFLAPAFVRAGAKKHSLSEDAALNSLLRTLERDHVYEKRISLDCVTFETEETTRIYFEIAVREKHNTKCGGDPETSPVIDRYRVNRSSGRIELYDAANDSWKQYKSAR